VSQFGFMDKPNIVEVLRLAENFGVPYDPERTTYFLSREELIPGRRSELPPLRRSVYIQMARNAQVAADFYGLPPGRVVEIGTRVEI
ncbi:MAG: potassium transporter Kup, partial [Gammaproteobacteria bacterium]|nr:potassium transporter Kup [Gammaproteobacteria bacterium]